MRFEPPEKRSGAYFVHFCPLWTVAQQRCGVFRCLASLVELFDCLYQVVCRDLLVVASLQRYTRDEGASVYFPQAVLRGQDLYDATLTDGDCRLRVTLDPGLNPLVERHVLRSGSTLRSATFTEGMSAQLPGHSAGTADTRR